MPKPCLPVFAALQTCIFVQVWVTLIFSSVWNNVCSKDIVCFSFVFIRSRIVFNIFIQTPWYSVLKWLQFSSLTKFPVCILVPLCLIAISGSLFIDFNGIWIKFICSITYTCLLSWNKSALRAAASRELERTRNKFRVSDLAWEELKQVLVY